MKTSFKLLALLLTIALLTGCSSSPQAESAIPTEDTAAASEATAPSTEPPTEPPTEAPTERELTAFEIFFKCKAAAPNAATSYTTSEHVIIRTGSNGITLCLDTTMDKSVFLSEDPFAIHICTDMITTMPGMEITQTVREYYLQEDEVPVYYADFEQLGYSVRTVLPDRLYPEIDSEEIPEDELPTTTQWLFATNSEQGYPPENYAEYIELEPETQMIDGREAYVLRYEQSALWLFGFTHDAAVDADLASIRIPTYWYIDKETFMPIKREFTMTDLNPLTTAAMVKLLNIQLPEDVTGLELEITEYTYVLKDMTFEPVDIPEVPQEVIDHAVSNSAAA